MIGTLTHIFSRILRRQTAGDLRLSPERRFAPTLWSRCAFSLLLSLCTLIVLPTREVVAAPLAHATQIVNHAVTQADGIEPATTDNTVVIVVRTPSQIEFLRVSSLGGTVHLQPSDYSSSGASSGPFVQLSVPPNLDLTQVPLFATAYFLIGEPVFVRLNDLDQNLRADQVETVLVSLTASTGDIELLRLYETGIDTGVFVGYTFTGAAEVIPGNGLLAVVQESQITASYTDIADSSDATATSCLFDPIGTVFDSTTGLPVDGVTITMIDMATGLPATIYGDDGVSSYPPTIVSGSSAQDSSGRTYTFPPGGYRFPLMPAGDYRLDVQPPNGWAAPSTVSTAALQSLPGAPWAILEPGSRGEPFTLPPVAILRLDIPLDPAAINLWVEKSAAKDVVAIGDFLPYLVKVTNSAEQGMARQVTVTDLLPRGFRYRKGSAKIDGNATDNPLIAEDGRTLSFALGTISPQQSKTISYVVEIAGGATPGDAVNSASATAPGGISSNTGKATVKVREDLFRSSSIIVGQVLDGCGEDARGIPGARIYLEDGSFVLTDKDGLYHFEGIRPIAHVVQLDTMTLPEGYSPLACEENTRFAGQNFSQFVDVQGGSLWRADFYAGKADLTPGKGLPLDISVSATNSATRGATGTAGLTLTSTIQERRVRYQVEIGNELVAIKDLKLILNLPTALSPLPGTTVIDDLPVDDPTVEGEHYVIALGDLTAGARHRLSFDAEIPEKAAGEMVATTILRFATTADQDLRTPEAVNRFTVTRTATFDSKNFVISTHFDSGLATLTPTDAQTLGEVVQTIDGWSIERIDVVGHTDSVRLSKKTARLFRDNPGLSMARASTVANALATMLGLPGEKITSSGKGETEPIGDNRREVGRAANRRVEVKIWLSKERIETAIEPLQMDSGPQQVQTNAALLLINDASNFTAPTVQGADSAAVAPRQEKELGILSPLDGSLLVAPVSGVRVRLDSRLKPLLEVDGQEIPADRIGFTMADPKTGKTLYSYIGVDFGAKGEHQLTIHGKDPFGNSRFKESATIVRTGAPVALKLIDAGGNFADGKTPVRLRLELLDEEGHTIKAGVELEFSSDTLKTIDKETSLDSTGRKSKFVHMDADGWVEFAPLSKSGPARISFKLNDLTVSAEPYIKPMLRDWILVGIGEGTVGYNRLSGNMESLDDTDIADSYYTAGRIAFFAKGKVKGEWLLTTGYDTGKTKENKLQGTIDPDAYYTLYGDGTAQQYDAASARRLYVKLERDQFYALFGDYDTGLTVTELARYSRSFNGFKSELQSRYFSYNIFASETSQAFVRDEIPGDGTSGLYRLSRRDLLINSEKIVIETRDRFHSETIVASIPLSRHVDYDIDYDAGTLFFKEPIASRDDNFNPIMIVVDYEAGDSRDAAVNYGGRGTFQAGEAIAVGASYIHEGASGATGDLTAIDATVKLGQTQLRAEAARSEAETGAGTTVDGKAYLVEVSHHGKDLDGRVYVREQESGFGLRQQRASEAGSRKVGSDGRYRLSDKFTLSGELSRQIMLDSEAERDLGQVEIKYSAQDYSLFAGLRQSTDRTATGEIDRSTQLLLGGSQQLTRRLNLRLSHDQSIFNEDDSADYPTRTLLGADYLLTEKVSIFVEQEFTTSDAQETDMTRAGLKASPWSGAQMQSTIQRQGSEDGSRVFATTGLKQTWQVNAAWSLDAGLDRSQTMRHLDSSTDDATAASGGAEDFTALSLGANRKGEKWTLSNRIEYRTSDSEDKFGLYSGAEGEVRPGLALSGRFQLFDSQGSDDTRSRDGSLRLGVAYRPVQTRWIILDRLDYLFEREETTSTDFHNWRLVNNLNANFHPNRQTQISFQYGAKYVQENIADQNYNSFTDLIGLECRQDFAKKWDVGLQGQILHSWQSNQYDYRLAPSVGYLLMKNMWLSGGYNLVGFQDDDFSAADFTAQGPFVKFRFKFDQNSVRDALKQF